MDHYARAREAPELYSTIARRARLTPRVVAWSRSENRNVGGDVNSLRLRGLLVAGLITGVWAISAAAVAAISNPKFNPEHFAWSVPAGANVITGSASLQTRGGDVKTCAGATAQAIPQTTYTAARIIQIYGRLTRGFADAEASRKGSKKDPQELQKFIRTAGCDAQGAFLFTDLPDGTYFITAPVSWERVGYGPLLVREGGWLMQRVSVSDGKSVKVVLTP